ncbi:glycosyltransferase family 2 protein [Luedemannella flava]
MPLLSIVIPIHGVEPYLRQCLDSVLGQAFTDFEVVAVDDASPDNCGNILQEYAARDPRVRVVRRSSAGDAGPARGAGFAVATGDHVWFVDGDDWLADGALEAIAGRLRETSADMLCFDAVYRAATDTVERFRPPAAVPEPFRFADWPGAFNSAKAWCRVVSRDLVVRAGSPFHAGAFEDLPFTFALLLAARRIAVLPGCATSTAPTGRPPP